MRTGSIAKQLMLGALVAVVIAGCHSGGGVTDERGWFRAFVARVQTDLRGSVGLVAVGAPYVGPCSRHTAKVSWQATLPPKVLAGYPSHARAVYEVSKTIVGRLRDDSALAARRVDVISASNESSGATDTLVLTPSSGTRVQVSVPFAAGVTAVGYVGC